MNRGLVRSANEAVCQFARIVITMATSSTLHQNDAGVAAEATEPSIPTSQAVSMNEKLSPTDKDPEKTSRQTHPTEEAKNVSNLRYYMVN